MKERISHELHAAMERVLRANLCSITGVILRLAYYEGLTRDEINNLQWDQVDFEEKQLCLSKRNVPLEGDTEACLRQWRILCGEAGGSVVVSEKSRKPLTPQSVSRIVRTALDAEGETGVRLLDLRTDYIRRQLEEHDWPYVLRVSGLSVTTYRNTLADTVPKGEAYQKEPCDAKEKEFRIWKILQSNQTTPAGIALWLSYQLGLQNEEIVSLTWDEVDFERGQIRLPGRSIALSNALSRILKAEQNTRTAEDDPHVILTPRTRKPLNNARLSTMVRTLLIRGGIEEDSLRNVRRNSAAEEEKKKVLTYVTLHGSISRGECMSLLQLNAGKAYARLNAWAFSGELVRVNARYYQPGAVIVPEKQEEAIKRYIAESGAAYCQDIAALLHIGKRSTARILKRMVDNGELILLRRQKCYILPKVKEAKLADKNK